MVDRWIGFLLSRVKDLGLWDETAIIFTTDHGFYLGEHNLVGKSMITPEAQGMVPLYSEIVHIPLMIRVPGVKPYRCNSIVQPPDLMPTILELAEAEVPETVQGMSLVPLLRGESVEWRDFAVSSPSIISGPVAGQRISMVTDEWFFIYCGQIDEALEDLPSERKTKMVDGFERLQKILGGRPRNELYYLPEDPGQEMDIFDKKRGVAEDLHAKLVEFLESLGTRGDILKYWRRLS